jgi:Zn-dependent alcohol dehydrogenase
VKTKGALLWELNSEFRIDEIDLGDPVADEVQIQLHAAGMCHSDYHLTTGATPIGLPALGGHEGAGVVTEVGKGVTGIAEGDHVMPFESAAILGCTVPTGFGSATNVAQVAPGETVAVVGVGGIGMSALQGAVLSGAKHVIAIDPVEFKREQAIKFGATHVYESMASAIAPMIDLTYGLMADKVIIAVGEMRGEMVEEAMTLTAKTGTCVVTGIGAMTDVDVKLNLFSFTMLQKTLKGNIFGGNSHVETPRLVGLYKSGLLKIDEMVTWGHLPLAGDTYRLEDINQGYQDMLDQSATFPDRRGYHRISPGL